MNILHLTHNFPTLHEPYGGVFTLEQIRRMSPTCRQSILFPAPWLPFVKPEWLKKKVSVVNFGENLDIKDHEIEVLRPTFLFIPRSDFVRAFQFSKLLKKEVSRRAYDLIHAHWITPSGYALLCLPRRLKLPTVVTVHAGDIYRNYYRITHRWMIKRVLERVDAVISVAKYFRYFFHRLGIDPSKIHYIPNGVDTTRFKPMNKNLCRRELRIPKNKIVYLYIGTLSEAKGVLLLLEAFGRLLDETEDIFLVLAGTGPLYNAIEQLFRTERFQHSAALFPAQPHENVPTFLNAADFFVLASESEGNPVTASESLCCGTPVLGSRIAGIRDIVSNEKFGLLFDRKIEDLLEVMRKAGKKVWNREKMAQKAQEEYGWTVVSSKIFNIYQNLSIRQ